MFLNVQTCAGLKECQLMRQINNNNHPRRDDKNHRDDKNVAGTFWSQVSSQTFGMNDNSSFAAPNRVLAVLT